MHGRPLARFFLRGFCPSSPSLHVEVGPLRSSQEVWERCKLPQQGLTSFGNNFNDFPENQLTKFCTDKRIKTIS